MPNLGSLRYVSMGKAHETYNRTQVTHEFKVATGSRALIEAHASPCSTTCRHATTVTTYIHMIEQANKSGERARSLPPLEIVLSVTSRSTYNRTLWQEGGEGTCVALFRCDPTRDIGLHARNDRNNSRRRPRQKLTLTAWRLEHLAKSMDDRAPSLLKDV